MKGLLSFVVKIRDLPNTISYGSHGTSGTGKIAGGHLGEKLAIEAVAKQGHKILLSSPNIRDVNQGGADFVTIKDDKVYFFDNKAYPRRPVISSVPALTTNFPQNREMALREINELRKRYERDRDERAEELDSLKRAVKEEREKSPSASGSVDPDVLQRLEELTDEVANLKEGVDLYKRAETLINSGPDGYVRVVTNAALAPNKGQFKGVPVEEKFPYRLSQELQNKGLVFWDVMRNPGPLNDVAVEVCDKQDDQKALDEQKAVDEEKQRILDEESSAREQQRLHDLREKAKADLKDWHTPNDPYIVAADIVFHSSSESKEKFGRSDTQVAQELEVARLRALEGERRIEAARLLAIEENAARLQLLTDFPNFGVIRPRDDYCEPGHEDDERREQELERVRLEEERRRRDDEERQRRDDEERQRRDDEERLLR